MEIINVATPPRRSSPIQIFTRYPIFSINYRGNIPDAAVYDRGGRQMLVVHLDGSGIVQPSTKSLSHVLLQQLRHKHKLHVITNRVSSFDDVGWAAGRASGL